MAEIEQISIKIGDVVFEFASNEQAKELRDMLNRIFPPESFSFPSVWAIPASVPPPYIITVINADPTGNHIGRVVNQMWRVVNG